MYLIKARNGNGTRTLTHAKTASEAELLCEVYALNLGPTYRITYKVARGNGRGIDGKKA